MRKEKTGPISTKPFVTGGFQMHNEWVQILEKMDLQSV